MELAKSSEAGHDFHAFLDTVNREIYFEHLIVLIKISIFGARYRLSYRMEKNPYRCIVPPLLFKALPNTYQCS